MHVERLELCDAHGMIASPLSRGLVKTLLQVECPKSILEEWKDVGMIVRCRDTGEIACVVTCSTAFRRNRSVHRACP